MGNDDIYLWTNDAGLHNDVFKALRTIGQDDAVVGFYIRLKEGQYYTSFAKNSAKFLPGGEAAMQNNKRLQALMIELNEDFTTASQKLKTPARLFPDISITP